MRLIKQLMFRRNHYGVAGLGRSQEGDTIVEVLIAIAIISLVLTTAYVITNRNTAALQENQERVQAQHLVESQIEALRAKGSLDTTGDCFIGTTETPSGPGSTCDSVTAPGSGASYKLAIDGPDGAGTYTVHATWTSLDANTNDNSDVTMYYRLNR